LPGGDLIAIGLRRIEDGDYASVESLFVFLAIPRMTASGFPELTGCSRHAPEEIELDLYRALSSSADPYGEYNALKNRLASFLSALEARWRRARDRTITP